MFCYHLPGLDISKNKPKMMSQSSERSFTNFWLAPRLDFCIAKLKHGGDSKELDQMFFDTSVNSILLNEALLVRTKHC